MTEETRTCALPECTETFFPRRSTQKFCSTRHAGTASNRRRNKAVVGYMEAEPAGVIEDTDLIRLAEERGYVIHKPEPALEPHVFDTSRIRGDRVRVAFVSDTHYGSKYQQATLCAEFMRYAEREAKVDCFIHGGDFTDGPFEAHRGAIHEMWTGTYDGQREAGINLFPQTRKRVLVIRGNHDEFYLKNAGGDIVRDICDARGFEYVGQTTAGALIQFGDVNVAVQHPHDGVGYALSYKLQRRIESLAPENKPHVLALGNYHKACHMPAWRNVEGFLLPAFQAQTAFLASKGVSSIVGGLIVEFGIVTKGLAPSLKTEWVLYREPLANDWPEQNHAAS